MAARKADNTAHEPHPPVESQEVPDNETGNPDDKADAEVNAANKTGKKVTQSSMVESAIDNGYRDIDEGIEYIKRTFGVASFERNVFSSHKSRILKDRGESPRGPRDGSTRTTSNGSNGTPAASRPSDNKSNDRLRADLKKVSDLIKVHGVDDFRELVGTIADIMHHQGGRAGVEELIKIIEELSR